MALGFGWTATRTLQANWTLLPPSNLLTHNTADMRFAQILYPSARIFHVLHALHVHEQGRGKLDCDFIFPTPCINLRHHVPGAFKFSFAHVSIRSPATPGIKPAVTSLNGRTCLQSFSVAEAPVQCCDCCLSLCVCLSVGDELTMQGWMNSTTHVTHSGFCSCSSSVIYLASVPAGCRRFGSWLCSLDFDLSVHYVTTACVLICDWPVGVVSPLAS